jgi:CRP-like cAMP-binding protein
MRNEMRVQLIRAACEGDSSATEKLEAIHLLLRLGSQQDEITVQPEPATARDANPPSASHSQAAPKDGPKESLASRLLGILEDLEPDHPGLTRGELAERLNCSPPSLSSALQQFRDGGTINASGTGKKGDPFRYQPKRPNAARPAALRP